MAKETKSKKTVAETPQDNEGKRKALDTTIARIEKDYGKGSIMKFGENT